MALKPSKASKEPRGAQKWVLGELRGLKPGLRLSTAEIAKRIGRASQKTFHKNSVYNALRILVKRGVIDVVRTGHQKMYRAIGHGGTVKRRATGDSPRPTAPPAGALTSLLPHKLALGEILVIQIGDREVVTATNLHGRLVLERHPIPK
ncbi:MAG: hypothetical protein L3J97_00600 [Thermoplasmata archaeon]|nr:hypothetical protein [Thermoplasmata archaeon]